VTCYNAAVAGDRSSELQRLETVASDVRYEEGVNGAMIAHLARVYGRYWAPSASCLELGPAEGSFSRVLAERFGDLTLVDGSERFCALLRERFPAATVVRALFEDYEPGRRFGTIVLGHVLEHVDDPPALLRRVRDWLEPEGRLFAAVPNARSVHRQAAVLMGLLAEEHALNDTDRRLGHRRVYDPESFRAEFHAAGFEIEVFGGFWLKPVSNGQIEASWTPEMLEAFMRVGERYPDIAAELYVIAR
jgi:2-polyprenyl-3-methyl-5-hydroxy-6-metoxy-1,4-benzoquinol methylase